MRWVILRLLPEKDLRSLLQRLTSLALFAAFVGIAKIDGIDIYRADVLAGLFVGAMIPFIFSSLAIRAVGEAAMAMVEEVRRQFRTIPGIMEGKGKPEYEKCVAISTNASIKKMMLAWCYCVTFAGDYRIYFWPGSVGRVFGRRNCKRRIDGNFSK